MESLIALIIRPEPIAEQDPKLPDQVADAWAAVWIDIYQRLKQREDAKPKQDGEAPDLVIGIWSLVISRSRFPTAIDSTSGIGYHSRSEALRFANGFLYSHCLFQISILCRSGSACLVRRDALLAIFH